jgi:F-type H+-transporting ATPase subunit gamma
MASGKEIRTKIKSIKNTQKITKAMEMVAASKMRRAQERMEATQPYTDKIWQVIGHLAHARPEYKHPYLVEVDQVQRVGFIVVTTDRGLCGGLNVNLLRSAISAIKEWRESEVEVDMCLIGRKGMQFFQRYGGNIVSQAVDLGDHPHLENVIGPVKVMLDAFTEGRIQRLYVAKNNFVNTMTQRPEVAQLLPAEPAIDEQLEYHWDYIYEPDAREVLDELLDRYVESVVYQSVVENVACEMAARMIAMKSASDNAGELIDDLNLAYNKARQAAITTELTEIVGGASAV